MCAGVNVCEQGFDDCIPEDCPSTLDVDNDGVLSVCACPDLNEDGSLTSQALDLCIGSRMYGDCIDSDTRNCDIPVIGYDGNCYSGGYIEPGETPYFKIYDHSENEYYFATPSENFEWLPNNFYFVDNLDVIEDCNGVLGGNAIIDECGICCGGNTLNDCSYYNNQNDFAGAYDCSGVCLLEPDTCIDNIYSSGCAFIDGCGDCVAGDTGLIECEEDCYGIQLEIIFGMIVMFVPVLQKILVVNLAMNLVIVEEIQIV